MRKQRAATARFPGHVNSFFHFSEIFSCGPNASGICRRSRVSKLQLLVKTPLRGANVLDAAGQLFEVIEGLLRVLQPFVVEREALDDVLLEALGRPDAKARRDMAFHPVADRDDQVEVVVIDEALDLAPALDANQQVFLVSCLR
jgi:hypothetical protein